MIDLEPAHPSNFVDNVTALLKRVEYRLAESESEREAIYRIRYDGYLREGSIGPNPARMFTDEFDDKPNTFVIGLHIDGELAATIRLNVASLDMPELPANDVFPDILLPRIERGEIIIDPTRNVVAYDYARRYPNLRYLTARAGWVAGEFFGADLILATVRTEHQAFFKRIFGHRLLCDARPYPTLKKPISLMVLDFPAERDRVLRRYPFLASTAAEREAIFGRVFPLMRHSLPNPEVLRAFC